MHYCNVGVVGGRKLKDFHFASNEITSMPVLRNPVTWLVCFTCVDTISAHVHFLRYYKKREMCNNLKYGDNEVHPVPRLMII
jgi:hypothetical protein